MAKEINRKVLNKSNDIIHLATSINPFSLAESLAGRRIEWNKYPDPTLALCGILNIPESELFSYNCPILRPCVDYQEDGTETELGAEKARIRLEQYLSHNMKRRITKNPPISSLSLKTLRKSIPDILVPNLLDDKYKRIPPMSSKVLGELTKPRPILVDREWTPEGFKWVDMGEFFKEVPEFNDPKQGNLADCYLIAALSSIVWTRPFAISNQAVPSSLDDDTSPLHRFTFHKDGKDIKMEITEKVLVRLNDGQKQWIYARSADDGETWVAILEKAYAKFKTGTKTDCPNMKELEYGFPSEACKYIIGGQEHRFNHRDKSNTAAIILKKIKDNCNGKKAKNPIFALTPKKENALPGLNYTSARLVENHAYSILGWDSSKNDTYIVLRNPWGYHTANLDVLKGSWNYGNSRKTKEIPYNQNGIFALRADTYFKYFWQTSFVDNDLFAE